jgi:hypothetical protein
MTTSSASKPPSSGSLIGTTLANALSVTRLANNAAIRGFVQPPESYSPCYKCASTRILHFHTDVSIGVTVGREKALDFGGCDSRFKTGKASLALNPRPAFGVTSAANPEMLPQPEPRAMREHFVVSSIRSRDGACIQRSNIRCLEHFL